MRALMLTLCAAALVAAAALVVTRVADEPASPAVGIIRLHHVDGRVASAGPAARAEGPGDAHADGGPRRDDRGGGSPAPRPGTAPVRALSRPATRAPASAIAPPATASPASSGGRFAPRPRDDDGDPATNDDPFDDDPGDVHDDGSDRPDGTDGDQAGHDD